MLSIITAIHNQLAMNQLFWKHLSANTNGAWELIVIDNGSSDGSGEFFSDQGAVVIRNDGNYSYPYCQNQGIKAAKGDTLAFLNNDVIVPKNWNSRLLESMTQNGIDVMTSCGIEHIESIKARDKKPGAVFLWQTTVFFKVNVFFNVPSLGTLLKSTCHSVQAPNQKGVCW